MNALTKRILKIRESIEDQQSVVLSVLSILGLLTKMADVCPEGELLLGCCVWNWKEL